MKKRTTTYQINEAITNNMLQVTKVEYYNKATYQMSTMDNTVFMEAFQFLCESGIFSDCTGWKFEKNHGAEREYIIETGRMNVESDCIVTVYLHVVDGAKVEDIEKILMVEEEEE